MLKKDDNGNRHVYFLLVTQTLSAREYETVDILKLLK